jgi:hypothetical protein
VLLLLQAWRSDRDERKIYHGLLFILSLSTLCDDVYTYENLVLCACYEACVCDLEGSFQGRCSSDILLRYPLVHSNFCGAAARGGWFMKGTPAHTCDSTKETAGWWGVVLAGRPSTSTDSMVAFGSLSD